MSSESRRRLGVLIVAFLCASILMGGLSLVHLSTKASPDEAFSQGIGTYAAEPVANAGADQTVNVGSTVTFDGSASYDDVDPLSALNLTWTFTYDSALQTIWGVNPTFTFSIAGTYVVTLTVTDTTSLTGTDTTTIYVNGPPSANAGPDMLVNSGVLTTLNASLTTDDFDSLATLNFTWSFTYGGGPVTLYGVTPSYVFVADGVYDITLTVRDSYGSTGTDQVTVTVNTAPETNAGPDQIVNVGATVTFDGSQTTDDMDTVATLNFTWSFTYGGFARNIWGPSPTYLFAEYGSYIVTLTVSDSNGLSSTDTMLVNVNGPPTADAGPDQGVLAGEPVMFDGSMSNDDGGATLLNYTWNFTFGSSAVVLYGPQPNYTFSAAGIFIVTLSVRDAGGLDSTDTMVVTVELANMAPIADAGDDRTATAGDIVVFDGGGSTDDMPTADLNYTWEFVYDGYTERLYGPQPAFEFDVAGTYTVTLTIRDDGGLTDADTMVITVESSGSGKSLISQYWWSLALVVVAAIILAALLAMRRRGGSSSKAGEVPEERVPEKIIPPPDEDEL